MKSLLAAIALLPLTATSAFALHETNCSSEDGTIQRIEEEIWGANPVYWVVDGVRYGYNAGVFDESTKVVLESQQSTDPVGLVSEYEKYQIEADIIAGDTVREDVLLTCIAWSNAALD
jgi:hypothetical protein